MQLNKHALYAPSSLHRTMLCFGAPHMEANEPNTENAYSHEGTVAHALRAHCLINKLEPKDILFLDVDGKNEIIPSDMREIIQDSVEKARTRSENKHLLVEQNLDLFPITGEKDAKGTMDEGIIDDANDTWEFTDYKHGMGVKVFAKDNPQILTYALAGVYQFSPLGRPKKILLRIDQPRLDHTDEHIIDTDELDVFHAELKKAIKHSEEARKSNSLMGFLNPGEVQCKFCKAAGKCPALAAQVAKITGADFEDETQNELVAPIDLGIAFGKIRMLETWIKGVQGAVESELLSGRPVKGYKLVEGKKGNRSWRDEDEIEQAMKAAKLTQEEMYNFSLLTPAKLEKKLKAKPKVWDKLSAFITQKQGQPSVAPISDPRTTYDPKPEADFEEVV